MYSVIVDDKVLDFKYKKLDELISAFYVGGFMVGINIEIAGSRAKTLYQFVREHNKANDQCRLGQRFVNIYISNVWSELFHESSDKKALETINKWLVDHQYYGMMPPSARETKTSKGD